MPSTMLREKRKNASVLAAGHAEQPHVWSDTYSRVEIRASPEDHSVTKGVNVLNKVYCEEISCRYDQINYSVLVRRWRYCLIEAFSFV